ncbi:hypothetical protein ANO11243_055090 [Dothideomycetidae sp. 11243]|nr:hypothetical protein ANO11243_055090 [fungal sp. No.11243]
MDPSAGKNEYPDPRTAAYATPYTLQGRDTFVSAIDGPYGDPSSGGLWQAAPPLLVQNGATSPQTGSDVDDALDSEDDLRGVYTRYEMNTILEQSGQSFDPDDSMNTESGEDNFYGEHLASEPVPRPKMRSSDPDFVAMDEGDSDSRGRGRRKGDVNKPADPGEAFKRQQALATEKYVSGDFEGAADLARAAVRSNPEIFAAHSLLSEVLLAQGKERDSLTVLLAGAHTKRDPELWHHVAQRTRALAGPTPDMESLDTAAYCYGWAIRLNGQDYEARRQRLNLLLESFTISGNSRTSGWARNECRAMLKLKPSDILVAREFAELAALSKIDTEIKLARELYDGALVTYSDSTSLGPNPSEDEQWNHVLAYVGLVERMEGTVTAISHFKRLARQVQKRRDQVFWDDFPNDDREFDSEGSSRKEQMPHYHKLKAAGSIGMRSNLPMDMRVKLGLYRLALGEAHYEEAIRHFNYLSPDELDVVGTADLVRDVADALKAKTKYDEALRFYEPLQNVPEMLDVSYYMDLATCYVELGRLSDAEDCYTIVVENNSLHWEARVALAKIYEDQGRRNEALPLIRAVVEMGRDDVLRKHKLFGPLDDLKKEQRQRSAVLLHDASRADQARTARPGRVLRQQRYNSAKKYQSRVSNIALERQRKLAEHLKSLTTVTDRVQSNYAIVESCQEDVAGQDEDAIAVWKTAVEGMLDEFRACKYLYPARDRHLKFIGYGRHARVLSEVEQERDRAEGQAESIASPSLSSATASIPEDFCDVGFHVWVDLFCSYSLQVAREGDRDSAYTYLDAALNSNVFHHSRTASFQLQMTYLACALIFNDEERLTTVSRMVTSADPSSPIAYQIFAVVHRLYAGPPSWFNAGPTQKYLLRSIKAFDWNVLPPEQRDTWNFTRAERNTLSGSRTHWAAGVSELQPNLLALYGHVMAAAQSWTGALNYYFRALSMRPDDPVLLLCVGLSYIQGAMKRQAENRHWSILTGLGFLGTYRRVRREMAQSTGRKVYEQEAEYNTARMWHFLGLSHLAIKGYRKCLEIRDEMDAVSLTGTYAMDVDGSKDYPDLEEYTQEAAMGLVNIYCLTGQTAKARGITEKYLVI